MTKAAEARARRAELRARADRAYKGMESERWYMCGQAYRPTAPLDKVRPCSGLLAQRLGVFVPKISTLHYTTSHTHTHAHARAA